MADEGTVYNQNKFSADTVQIFNRFLSHDLTTLLENVLHFHAVFW